MTTRDELRAAARAEARRQLWREGAAASYLLDTAGPTGGQQAWASMLDATPRGGWCAWEISRQRGKTFTALTWAFGRLGRAQASAAYIAQTGVNAEAIVEQFVKELADEFPPEWGVRVTDGEVRFSNGSTMSIFGTDNQQHRRSRGRKTSIVLLDEAGFYADLLDVEQVYQPQLQTTGGVGLYLSSPAMTVGHEFSRRCDALKVSNRYVRDTFWSNPRIDHEGVIKGEMERLCLTREQLLTSTAFRREFLAERVTEESRAALPSWTEEAQRACVLEVSRPPHWDGYVGCDWGFQPDPSAALFAWHDVAGARLVIEEELELRGATLSTFAAAAKVIEVRLYGADRFDGTLLGAKDFLERSVPDVWLAQTISDRAPRQPYLRVGDDDKMVLPELASAHGLAIMPSRKDDKHMAVDGVNQLIRERRLIVHPRCRRLLTQMQATLWNKTRSEWERTSTDHGDLIDALVYLVRNIRWHRDCRPEVPRDVFRGGAVAVTRQQQGLRALAGGVFSRRT